MSTTTTGSASPSLSPLSMLSNWRSRAGTSVLVTIAEANTGSVGLSTAPTRKAVTQSSPATKWASTEMPRNVSGIPSSRARPDSRHAARNSGTPARWPSVNSTVNRARSASVDTIGLFGVSCSQPKPPEPATAPASRNISDVDSTVRAASPDTRTTMSSATPKMRTSAMYCALPGPREPAVPSAALRGDSLRATGDPTPTRPDGQARPTSQRGRAAATCGQRARTGRTGRVAAAVTSGLGQRLRPVNSSSPGAGRRRRRNRRPGSKSPTPRLSPVRRASHLARPTQPTDQLAAVTPVADRRRYTEPTPDDRAVVGATEHPGLRRLLDIPGRTCGVTTSAADRRPPYRYGIGFPPGHFGMARHGKRSG